MRKLDRWSTPIFGTLIAAISWPFVSLLPGAGIDPSWFEGIYMATERGLDYGTQVLFSFGPLGFLEIPGAYTVGLGRLAFFWSAGVHLASCIAVLWCTRRAFGLLLGIGLTVFTIGQPSADKLLIIGAIVGVAALIDEWSPRQRLALAIGAGVLAGVELLATLRIGPTLVAMTVVVLAALPERRRTFAAFAAAAGISFLAFWFAAGQGIGNLDDYAAGVLNVLGGYSSAMAVSYPGDWWQVPAMIAVTLTLAGLCAAAVWHRDTARRIAVPLLLAVVVLVMYKHSVVRYVPFTVASFIAAMLTIGLGLTPFVNRVIAVLAIALLAGLSVVANNPFYATSFAFGTHLERMVDQTKTVVLPGRMGETEQAGKLAIRAALPLPPEQLELLQSGSVHIATLETAVAYGYDLDWDPLPVFQQYTAYTEYLDDLNASKLESGSAPDRILWENATIDNRAAAWDSPRATVQMMCRYRVEYSAGRWAVLRHGADRCGREREIETVTVASGAPVPLPKTRPGEALLVHIDGLGETLPERLGTFLFQGPGRTAVLGERFLNVVAATAGDGLILTVPPDRDYPGTFALGTAARAVSFSRNPGLLTGIGDGPITLDFRALPLRAPGTLPGAFTE